MPWIARTLRPDTSASRMTASHGHAMAGRHARATRAWQTLAILGFTLAILQATPAFGQSSNAPRVSCVANAAGDRWICETGQDVTRADPRIMSSRADNAVVASTPTDRIGNNNPARLDWVAREAMTPAQRAALPDDCCGGFIDPQAESVLRSSTNTDKSNRLADEDSPTITTQFISSDGLSQRAASSIDLRGEVTVVQGARTITNRGTETSAQTILDRDANTVSLRGDIAFREPGVLLRGNEALIDSNSGRNTVDAAHYVLHSSGIHGAAKTIDYDSETGLIMLDNGEFSRCEPGNEFWVLRANAFELDQAIGRGRAKAMSLRIRDIPIFYYPGTVQFPIGDQRLSGLLPPSIGSSRTGGVDIEVPYYLNLAPQMDATLSPRLLSDRGVMLGAEFRYLAKTSMNTLNASYLGGDKFFDPATVDTLGSESPSQENRWFIGFEHQGQFGNGFSTYVDYNAVSDNDYFFDFGNGGLNLSSQTHLNRQARIDFRNDYLRAGINAQRLQIIDPFAAALDINKPFDRLPQFTLASQIPLGAGFRIAFAGEATAFDRTLEESLLSQAKIDAGALVTGTRVNLEPEISWSAERPGWFIRAKSKYLQRSYSLDKQALGTADSPDFGVPVTSLDTGLIFERTTGRSWTQTLEPRVYALDSGFAEQSEIPLFDSSELNFSFAQLFRDERFAGGDRVSNARQVSAALTTRLLDTAGRERARASLGQIIYFEDRLVDLSNPLQNWAPRYSTTADGSAIAAEVFYAPTDRWRFLTDVQWDEETQQVIEGRAQIRYRRDSSHLVNLAYRERNLVSSPNLVLPPAIDGAIDPHIRQTDFSAVWPLATNWKILARWNYDHSNARNLESFTGVEYSNCCAKIRLVAREWINENELFVRNFEPNRGIFVQFTLVGLGNLTGGGLDSLLTEGIQGYDSER